MATRIRHPFASILVRLGAILLGCALVASSTTGHAQVMCHDRVIALAAGPDRAIYAVGVTSGDLSQDGAHQGGMDAWLARFGSHGRLIWLRQFGQEGEDGAVAVAVDTIGNIYVTGYRLDDSGLVDGWVRKFDSLGNQLWNRTIAGLFPAGYSVKPSGIGLDGMGHIILAGNLRLEQLGDVWMLALDMDGNPVWQQRLDSGTDETVTALAVAADGQIYLTGHSVATEGASDSGNDVWLAQFGPTGVSHWYHRWGSDRNDAATALATDVNGDVLVAGYTRGALGRGDNTGSIDLWLARFNSRGNRRWQRQWGGIGLDLADSLAVDGDGHAYVAGVSESAVRRNGRASSQDIVMVAFDRAGRQLWHKLRATKNRKHARAVVVGGDGSLYLGGDQFDDQFPGDDDSGYDALLSSLDLDGHILWRRLLRSGNGLPSLAAADQETSSLTHYIIVPADADPDSTQWQSPHQIYLDQGQPANSRLVIFLPGTGAVPDEYGLLLQSLARRGYYVIGLNYPNDSPVGTLCGGRDTPSTCFGDVRLETLYGEDTSDLVDIPLPESILSRLTALLVYLNDQYPADGWNRWIENGSPDWANIIASGHSQGGGDAALLGKEMEVARVIMLSATEDTGADGQPAPWITQAGLTPSSSYYGFDHIHDPFWKDNLNNWSALGLDQYGDVVSVDSAAGNFAGSHRLSTAMLPSTGKRFGADPHNSPAADAYTPLLEDGTPWYDNDGTWDYLLEGE